MRIVPALTEKDFLVVFIPDTGNRYLRKLYDDQWMRDHEYLEPPGAAAADEG
jgi:cystathionine beta-synthase